MQPEHVRETWTVAAPARDYLERLRQGGADAALFREEEGLVRGRWFGCQLGSVFQPVVSAGQCVAHEAFLRIHGHGRHAGELSPWPLFSANAEDARLVALDRLARTLHTLNFLLQQGQGALFLNVHGRLLAAVRDDHGAAFRRVVDALGVPPGRIVIETPVSALAQPDLLAFVLRNYRRNGFRTAVKLASPQQWSLVSPLMAMDYVKLEWTNDPCFWAGVQRIAASGAVAHIVVTRVEGEDAAAIQGWGARFAAGCQLLLQGYAFGRPQALV